MKAILCTECGDLVVMRYPWKMCECGRSGGQYKPDGDKIKIGGPCRVYGIDNRVLVTGRADCFLYPEDNGKVERIKGTGLPTHHAMKGAP